MHKKPLILMILLCCFFMLPCYSEASGQKSYTITWNNQSHGPCHPLTVQTKVAALSPETFEDKDVLLPNATRSMTFSPTAVLRSGSLTACTMQLSTLCYYRGLSTGVSISSVILPCASGTATFSTSGFTLSSP